MSIGVMVAIFIVMGVVGVVSTKYLGDGNPIEKEAEHVMEEEAEEILHLPEGSLEGKIDLDLHKTHNT